MNLFSLLQIPASLAQHDPHKETVKIITNGLICSLIVLIVFLLLRLIFEKED